MYTLNSLFQLLLLMIFLLLLLKIQKLLLICLVYNLLMCWCKDFIRIFVFNTLNNSLSIPFAVSSIFIPSFICTMNTFTMSELQIILLIHLMACKHYYLHLFLFFKYSYYSEFSSIYFYTILYSYFLLYNLIAILFPIIIESLSLDCEESSCF